METKKAFFSVKVRPHFVWGVLFGLGVAGFVGLRVFWLQRIASPIIVDQVSPRAQEFIRDQSKAGTGLWAQVQLEDTEPAAPSIQPGLRITTDCFSFELPFEVTNTHFETNEQYCTWRAQLKQLFGAVVVSRRNGSDLNQDSGVLMRRRDSVQYTESSLAVAGFEEILIFRSPQTITLFATQQKYLLTISFTDLIPSQIPTDTTLQTILESVTLED